MEYIEVCKVINRLSRKYFVNSVWLWDVVAENWNYIKGLGCIMTKEEAKELEEIAIHAFD